jgi:isopenicillin-N epimerase
MMKLDVHDLGCDMYSASPHKWLQATKGTGFLYVRDEVIDRVWNTIATEGWDDTKLRAERFQRIGSANVPTLCGLRAAIEFANQIGMERIENATGRWPIILWLKCKSAVRLRGLHPMQLCAARLQP